MFTLLYHHLVVRGDIPKIPAPWKDKIREAIELKLQTQPEVYGKPLRRSLKGYRKLRVGDYRVIFRVEHDKIKILAIGHRSKIYQSASKRL